MTDQHVHHVAEASDDAVLGPLDRPEPLEYVRMESTVVVEIEADVAFEHQRWRHRVKAVRARPDMSVYDVPLLLGEQEGYFGET